MGKFGSEGKENNTIVYLRFNIVECIRGSYDKTLWDKLGKLYLSKSLVNNFFLRKMLYNPRMKDKDSVTKNMNALNTMVS